MALLRPPGLYKKRSRFIFDDRCVSAYHVEVSARSCLPRGASRCRSSVPNVLPRSGLARTCAVLHGCIEGNTDRKSPRDRRDPRVGTLCSRCRSSCYFGASEATRLRLGYGVVGKRIDYFGASELTIFPKRGSPRRESQ